MGSRRAYDPDQCAEVLALLRQRGHQGISSLEAIDLGWPRMQVRISELRHDGWPIESVPGPGRTTTYVLRPGAQQGEGADPLDAGCRVVLRGGVLEVRPYGSGPHSQTLADEVRRFVESSGLVDRFSAPKKERDWFDVLFGDEV